MPASPPPSPAIRSVRQMGRFPAASRGDWALVGQDGGQSIDLGGATLFLFADTLLADVTRPGGPQVVTGGRWTRENARFLGNCAAVTTADSIVEAVAGLSYFEDEAGWPREVLEPTPVERMVNRRFWPQHGLLIDGAVHLFYLGIEQDGPGTWDFRAVGTGLAVLDPTTGRARRREFAGDWRLWPALDGALHGGVRVLREGDRAYVFHSMSGALDTQAYLSRAPVGRLADPAAYEHLASSSPAWTGEPEAALSLGPCGRDFSVSFNRFLDLYLMIYVDAADRNLTLRVAREVWGPYGEPRKLGALAGRKRSSLLSLAIEHSGFAVDAGRTIHVSYCQPHFTQNELVAVTFG